MRSTVLSHTPMLREPRPRGPRASPQRAVKRRQGRYKLGFREVLYGLDPLGRHKLAALAKGLKLVREEPTSYLLDRRPIACLAERLDRPWWIRERLTAAAGTDAGTGMQVQLAGRRVEVVGAAVLKHEALKSAAGSTLQALDEVFKRHNDCPLLPPVLPPIAQGGL